MEPLLFVKEVDDIYASYVRRKEIKIGDMMDYDIKPST